MRGVRWTRDAVCHGYSQFTTMHGLRASRGYRGDGRALDGMISDSVVRWNIANRIRANARELRVSEVYRQRIWTVQRSSEGGVRISDRGSPIAKSHVPRGRLRLRQWRSTL